MEESPNLGSPAAAPAHAVLAQASELIEIAEWAAVAATGVAPGVAANARAVLARLAGSAGAFPLRDQNRSAVGTFLALGLEELAKARRAHPAPRHTMVALTEEVGELARACLHAVSPDEENPYAREDVVKEGVQVLAMVLRVLTEGDWSLDLPAPIQSLPRFPVPGDDG